VPEAHAILDSDLVVRLGLEKLYLCARCRARGGVQREPYGNALVFFKDQGNVEAERGPPGAHIVVQNSTVGVQKHLLKVLDAVRARSVHDLLQYVRHSMQQPRVSKVDDIHREHEFQRLDGVDCHVHCALRGLYTPDQVCSRTALHGIFFFHATAQCVYAEGEHDIFCKAFSGGHVDFASGRTRIPVCSRHTAQQRFARGCGGWEVPALMHTGCGDFAEMSRNPPYYMLFRAKYAQNPLKVYRAKTLHQLLYTLMQAPVFGLALASTVKMDPVSGCGGGGVDGVVASSPHASRVVVLLDYADVVPGRDARLLEHDLSHMRALID